MGVKMENSYLWLFVETMGRGISTIQYEEIGARSDEEAIQRICEEDRVRSGKSVSTIRNLGLKRIERGEDGLVVSVETVPIYTFHPLGAPAIKANVEEGLTRFTKMN